ncbi:pentapeptide repeat-containing protein [Streptomyces fildesensis]|uniref:pentapeptide repeat-containing protein n=1 Tax=Streptomyces fildesensis TaxID=375757 RepID=UPI0018DF11EA|nr:pentapeptide repeat-containing protein [Streptomyces fildesensis]
MSAISPDWPTCDAFNCTGIKIASHDLCVTHLSDQTRMDWISRLNPGDEVDFRGVHFDDDTLWRICRTMSQDWVPIFGTANFEAAHFTDRADFSRAKFQGDAIFEGATFDGHVGFMGTEFWLTADFSKAQFRHTPNFRFARFSDWTSFDRAIFTEGANFSLADFFGRATFYESTFEAEARFSGSYFRLDALFHGVKFSNEANFSACQFAYKARFSSCQFAGVAKFDSSLFDESVNFANAEFMSQLTGPIICCGNIILGAASFFEPVRIDIAAESVDVTSAQFRSPAVIRIRNGEVDITDVKNDQPLTIASRTSPFDSFGATIPSDPFGEETSPATIPTLLGVDAAQLTLVDMDLTGCIFSGALHLDQIRINGRCAFATPPSGIQFGSGRIPFRLWTRRNILAEESRWRALPLPHRPAVAISGWTPGPDQPSTEHQIKPADLAGLYRELRKALEDGKNEPGAADFYYGEMESRRHDREGTPKEERLLLGMYWLLSGYGLRAARALGWLLLAMTITVLLMMGFGIPSNSSKSEATGIVPTGGGRVALVVDKPDPYLSGTAGARFTKGRFEKSFRVVVNSVVFRSSEQDLTVAGTYIEMASRFGEPILLGLAALAVRGRVKRS